MKDLAIAEVYNIAMTGLISPTQDRLQTSKALGVLRTLEMRKEQEVEMAIQTAYRQCREPIMKAALAAALDNNLRFVDVALIMEMLSSEAQMLGVWEYENLDLADGFLEMANPEAVQTIQAVQVVAEPDNPRKGVSSAELFKKLGIKECEDDCDCDSD